jgi:hypothetical protein
MIGAAYQRRTLRNLMERRAGAFVDARTGRPRNHARP